MLLPSRRPPAIRCLRSCLYLTVNKLRLLYLMHGKGGKPGKQNKQHLIDALIIMIPDPQQLMTFVLLLPPPAQWNFLKKALNKAELKDDHYPLDWGQLALSCGYMYLFHHDGEFVYIVPAEVKAAYKTMDSKEFRQVKRFREQLNEFACAAVNLYGALTFAEFVKLMDGYVEYGRDKLTVEDLESHLKGYTLMSDDYRITEGCIVSIVFTDEDNEQIVDMEVVRSLVAARQGKPRYAPDVETFLDYADPDYYEETKEVKALKSALVSYGVPEDRAEDLIDTLHERIEAEEDLSDVLTTLEECGVTLKEQQFDQAVKLVVEMGNATRLWSNFGHTPNELVGKMGLSGPRAIHFGPGITEMFKRGELNISDLERAVQGRKLINEDFKGSFMSEVARVKKLAESGADPAPQDNVVPLRKPGRNDPCPCGSGLKYKKCCGKNAPE